MDFDNQEINQEEKDSRRPLFGALLSDKIASFVIFSGGLITIVAVIGILAFVLWEALPLISGLTFSEVSKLDSKNDNRAKAILTGIDEYKEIAYLLYDDGVVDFIDVYDKSLLKTVQIDSLYGKRIAAYSKSVSDNYLGIGTNDGHIAALFIAYSISFDENSNRIIKPSIEIVDFFKADSNGNQIKNVIFRSPYEDLKTLFFELSDGTLWLKSYISEKNFLNDEEEISVHLAEIPKEHNEKITSATIDDISEKLLIGTERGRIIYYSIKDYLSPSYVQIINAFNSSVSSLCFVLGDQTFIAGSQKGEIYTFTRVQDPDSRYGWIFNLFKKFKEHSFEITSIAVSSRNKSFIIGDNSGKLSLYHLTMSSKITDLLSQGNSPVADISYAPKADGVTSLLQSGELIAYDIDNRHSEFNFRTVFGKVLYEGYKKPDYVWQSTGGTDDFEPKFSLIPLLFGTLKGTFFALLFSVPISLLAAIYTSLFMNDKLRNYIKPAVEMMSALPSVVIGFIAGIWLAPLLDRIIPGMVLFFLFLLLFSVFILILNSYEKGSGKGLIFNYGNELPAIFLVFIISATFAVILNDTFVSTIFNGDFKQWVYYTFNTNYEQRNGLIVGFALGFAVIPIMFTISEDSLHNVPKSLSNAAYSLGADRWQTAWRVIIPAASPGIFSAVMIGFGRAIGETMIVLMATGNTPLMDLSIFNGMRTLSANIAIEIPEAPVGGTLYRVLFLSAFLLFLLTFFVNTIAEIVRQRLRKKFINL